MHTEITILALNLLSMQSQRYQESHLDAQEPKARIALATSILPRWHSTAELQRHNSLPFCAKVRKAVADALLPTLETYSFSSLIQPLYCWGLVPGDGVAPPEALPSDLQSDPLLSTVYPGIMRCKVPQPYP